jgi:hypothetical protein
LTIPRYPAILPHIGLPFRCMRNPTRISIFSTLPRLPIAMAKSFAWGTCRPVLMSCEQPILTYTLLAQRRCTSPHASFLLLACISGSSWPILTIASTLTQHQPVFCAPAAPRRPLPPAVLFLPHQAFTSRIRAALVLRANPTTSAGFAPPCLAICLAALLCYGVAYRRADEAFTSTTIHLPTIHVPTTSCPSVALSPILPS